MKPIIDKQYHWYAVYTRSRNEKKVRQRLVNNGYDVYLPLITREKQWSDRLKKVEEPLFRSYLFARVSNKEYYQILQDPAVVRYVTFEGKAAIIPDKQIELIRSFLQTDLLIETSTEHIEPGTMVRISLGPFVGQSGEMVRYAGSQRIIVRIDIIGQALLVNVPLQYIEK